MPKLKKTFPDFQHKNILILGLGLLGRGLKDTIFFAERGANVTVTDLKNETDLKDSLAHLSKYPNIKYVLGEHREEDILNADLIIRNADVPIYSPFLQYAITNKKAVDMDESLFAEYCPCPIIGVTGTRGKSTTTTLIGHILQSCLPEKKIYLAGNLLGEASLPLIDVVTPDDLVVLELSSWQLQGFGWKKLSPQVAVFTNISEDHLNRYKSMEEYIDDKKNIFKFQKKSDFCVINKTDPYTSAMENEVKAKKLWFSAAKVPADWQPLIRGEHNRANISAALEVGKIFGLTDEQMRGAVESFTGLEHRQEFVASINNITFINDSNATTPVAAAVALDTFTEPIVLIAGGAAKKLDMTPFVERIITKAKAVVLLDGTATDDLEEKIVLAGGEKLIVGRFKKFSEAVERAYSLSLPGDVVLLSPGCASFGMFVNEYDRGNQFKKIVKQLK